MNHHPTSNERRRPHQQLIPGTDHNHQIHNTMTMLSTMNIRSTKMKTPFSHVFRFVFCLLCIIATCSAFSSQSPTTRMARPLLIQQRYNNDSQRSLHRLQASPDDSNTSKKAKVRFSGIDLDKDTNTATNPVDYLLLLITSDIGSIVLGLAGIVVLLVGRALLDNTDSFVTTGLDTRKSISAIQVARMGQETRSNLLAVFACGAVLLNGISKLDVTSVLAETVILEGTELDKPLLLLSTATDNSQSSSQPLESSASSSSVPWVLESLVSSATPAKTAVLLQRKETSDADSSSWKILAMAGTVPDAWAAASASTSTPKQPQLLPYMPIIERFQSGTNRESYLPTLQALPGRSEFTYLPDNTQAVLLIPVLTSGDVDDSSKATATTTKATSTTTTVIALGADQARSFTPRNVAWSQAVAARLAAEMEEPSSPTS
jgi:hypothetical protein